MCVYTPTQLLLSSYTPTDLLCVVCTGVLGVVFSSHARPHACPHAGSKVGAHSQKIMNVVGAKMATRHDTPRPCRCQVRGHEGTARHTSHVWVHTIGTHVW